MGKDDPEVKSKRDQLRERIKANLLAAAAAGHDLEGRIPPSYMSNWVSVV
jgi:hypothetical protein